MKHVQVFVGSIRAEFFIDQVDVLIVKGLSLLGIVYFEDAKHSHDVCAFSLVGLLGHHGWDDCLEVGTDWHERVPMVLQ